MDLIFLMESDDHKSIMHTGPPMKKDDILLLCNPPADTVKSESSLDISSFVKMEYVSNTSTKITVLKTRFYRMMN